MPKRKKIFKIGRHVFERVGNKVIRLPGRQAAAAKTAGGHSPAAWPKTDDLCSVKDHKKFSKMLASKGINADTFVENGRVKIRLHDRNERKRVYEAQGKFDISAGLSGDPKPSEKHYEYARQDREAREAAEREERAMNDFIREFESHGGGRDSLGPVVGLGRLL